MLVRVIFVWRKDRNRDRTALRAISNCPPHQNCVECNMISAAFDVNLRPYIQGDFFLFDHAAATSDQDKNPAKCVTFPSPVGTLRPNWVLDSEGGGAASMSQYLVGGGIENKHSTNVEYPPLLPRVFMSIHPEGKSWLLRYRFGYLLRKLLLPGHPVRGVRRQAHPDPAVAQDGTAGERVHGYGIRS